MTFRANLIAWIEPHGSNQFVGAYVGEGAGPDPQANFAGRAPATRLCSSREEAGKWIVEQATALDLPIKWISQTRHS
jgi:hypothetical protein